MPTMLACSPWEKSWYQIELTLRNPTRTAILVTLSLSIEIPGTHLRLSELGWLCG